MKKVLTYIVTFIVCSNASAQITEVSADVSGIVINRTVRIFASPQFVINQGNHSLHIGPSILMYSANTVADMNYPKPAGLQLNYQYNTLPDKRLSFFLFNKLLLHYIENRWSSASWNNDQNRYAQYRFKNAEFLAADHVGYGVKLKLFDRFSISQSTGIGVYFSSTDNDEISENAPEISDKNINGYSMVGFSWGVSLNVSYKL